MKGFFYCLELLTKKKPPYKQDGFSTVIPKNFLESVFQ